MMRRKTSTIRQQRRRRNPRQSMGLSLVEMMISLAITAMLLTATMVAIDASFRAYAAAAEAASTQTTTRLVVHKLLTLIRTSTAHGPLLPDSSTTPPVTISGKTITSHYMDLLDPNGDLIRLEYREAEDMIYVTVTPFGAAVSTTQPLLGGVTDCQFVLTRRLDNDGIWVLERGSIDFTVVSDSDSSLALEGDEAPPMRVIASTMPRKLD